MNKLAGVSSPMRQNASASRQGYDDKDVSPFVVGNRQF